MIQKIVGNLPTIWKDKNLQQLVEDSIAQRALCESDDFWQRLKES